MSQLTIHLFGEFEIALEGRSVNSIQPGRQQALLAYLLLHRNTPLSRRRLAFLFWPDSSEAQAHANLRQLLHHLRHALPSIDQFLKLDGRTIHWESEQPLLLDVAEFERGLAQVAAAERSGDRSTLRSALEQTVDLYRGDLLPGCYEDWLLLERERWRERFIAVLDRLIVLLEEVRDYPAAIVYAQRLLRHDPLHELTYQRLMTLFAANGERASALRTYHSCATILQRELGVEPQATTQALHARLMEMTGQPALQPPANATVNRLIGRQSEWAKLHSIWRTVLHGRAHAVLVYGKAGIGKSRLLEELLHWANQQGITTAYTRSYAAEGALAYAPVIDWLRSEAIQAGLPGLEPAWLAQLARLLPELAAGYPAAQPQDWGNDRLQRRHLHEALARAFLHAKQPLLLVIDDLQWCDQETIEWLHHFIRGAQKSQVLVAGAVRPEELTAQHPLHPLLVDLRIAGLLTEMELGPLNAQESVLLAWFTEGLDTPDLIDARQLLDSLSR